MANANRRKKSLAKVKINGVCLTEEIEIKEGIVRSFKNLLSDLREWQPYIKDMYFDALNVQWTKSVVNEGPLPLLSFFDWLGASRGMVLYLLFFCLSLKVPFVYPLYAFGSISRCPFLIYFCVCLSKKKFHKLLEGLRVIYTSLKLGGNLWSCVEDFREFL